MNIDKIRKGAPDGATHYKLYKGYDACLRCGFEVITYYKIFGGMWVRVLSGGLCIVVDNRTIVDLQPL